jgi:hypothetical protein
VVGGNVNTTQLSATGSIIGSNLSVTNAVIAGNLTVTGSTEYTNVSTLAIQDPIIGIGRGANNSSLSSNDGKDRGEALYYYDTSEKVAFIGYDSSTSKLIAATSTSITDEVVTVATYGSFVVGQLEGATINMTGTATVGNLSSGGAIGATGSATVGNVLTGGLISAGGNVTGGNILSAGLVSIAGNVTGANVNATSSVSAAANVVATGNVRGGNVISTALVQGASISVTGNTATVTTANYSIGYRDIPQIGTFSTLATTDGGKHYYGSGTITIPTNASVALNIGTTILVVASGATTISNAAGVSLIQAGSGATGARTLAQYGMATIIKVNTDLWYISGTGIS